MRTGVELIGKPIYGITDGRQIGTVEDLYLDEDLRKVTCIYLGQEGLLGRRSNIIQREDVMVFGINSILTKDSNVIIESGKLVDTSTMIRLESLKRKEVFTAGDTRVARIRDVILDDELYLMGFTLGRVFVEGPIAVRGAIAREALLESLSLDEKIIIDLSIAEEQDLGVIAYT